MSHASKDKKLFDSKEDDRDTTLVRGTRQYPSVVNIGDGLFGASGTCGSYSCVCAVIVGEGWHTLFFRK